MDINTFQQTVAVVDNVVRAYNQFVFDETLTRWINSRVLTGNWKTHDRAQFGPLFDLFVSRGDGSRRTLGSAYAVWTSKLRPIVAARARGRP